MSSAAVRLAPGLVGLHHDVPADGFAPYPAGTPGRASVNQYLLTEGRTSLLVDTGLSAHEDALLALLAEHHPAGGRLEVLPLRLGEFDSVCNVAPVHDRFGLAVLHAAQPDGATWVGFRPGDAGRTDLLDGVRVTRVGATGGITIGPGRTVTAFRPLLRLLPTHWLHDGATGTLFTSDAFTHVLRPRPDSPWTVTADDDPTTPAGLRELLLGGRFWWLDGARTGELVADLDRIAAGYDIVRIAPAYGRVLEGRAVVRRHLGLVRDALTELGRVPVPR